MATARALPSLPHSCPLQSPRRSCWLKSLSPSPNQYISVLPHCVIILLPTCSPLTAEGQPHGSAPPEPFKGFHGSFKRIRSSREVRLCPPAAPLTQCSTLYLLVWSGLPPPAGPSPSPKFQLKSTHSQWSLPLCSLSPYLHFGYSDTVLVM